MGCGRGRCGPRTDVRELCCLAPPHPKPSQPEPAAFLSQFVAPHLHRMNQFHFPPARGPSSPPRSQAGLPSGPTLGSGEGGGSVGRCTIGHDRSFGSFPQLQISFEGLGEKLCRRRLSWPGPFPLFGLAPGCPGSVCERISAAATSRDSALQSLDCAGDPGVWARALLRYSCTAGAGDSLPAGQPDSLALQDLFQPPPSTSSRNWSQCLEGCRSATGAGDGARAHLLLTSMGNANSQLWWPTIGAARLTAAATAIICQIFRPY